MEDPEAELKKLMSVPSAPDSRRIGTGDPKARRAYHDALDRDVHSHGALVASRQHCIVLVETLSAGEKKDEYLVKQLERELVLQESIQKHSYIDNTNHVGLQRILGIAAPIGCFVLALVSFVFGFFHRSDTETFKLMLSFTEWMFAIGVAPIIAHLFRRKP